MRWIVLDKLNSIILSSNNDRISNQECVKYINNYLDLFEKLDVVISDITPNELIKLTKAIIFSSN